VSLTELFIKEQKAIKILFYEIDHLRKWLLPYECPELKDV
jgi:hypothetical protein